MNREDALRPRLHFNCAGAGHLNRVAYLIAFYGQVDDGTAAVERPSACDILAPVIVVEFLISRETSVRAINADRHITRHFVRAAN